MEKVWRCTVCGYLHKGPEPPERCPVCGVGADDFVLQDAADYGSAAAGEGGVLFELRSHFVLHAVAAHFPNALIPILLLFALAAQVSEQAVLAQSLLPLLMVLAPLCVLTMCSGLRDWKRDYRGEDSPLFRRKRVLSGLLSGLSLVALVWAWLNPRLFLPADTVSGLFLLLLLAMLICAVLLGHYGAVLVFGRRRKRIPPERSAKKRLFNG